MSKKIAHIVSATLAAVLVAAIAFTGCSSQKSSSQEDSTPEASSTQASAGATSTASNIKVGLALSTKSNAFFIGMEKGIADECKVKGYTLEETNANGQVAKQLSDAEDLISKGVSVLIVNALDSEAIVPVTAKAKAANIPLVFCDRGPSSGDYASFLESDNVTLGKLAATNIVKFLTQKYGSAKGNVVDIQGVLGSSPATDREKGFSTEISKYPDIKIVAKQAGNFDQEKSMNVMQNILQANPKIDAVFGANDDCSVGAEKAMKAANRLKLVGDADHIYIIGIDGINQALTAVKNGEQDISISQDPIKMGAQAVDVAVDALNGTKVDQHIYTKYFEVNKSNAADPSNWGNQVK